MLTRTIHYTNFNDEPKNVVAHFHLGKADIARIAADPSFVQDMLKASREQDTKVMLEKIEHLVRLAYGIRSEDGERFIKNKEVQDAFIQSAAYEEFLLDLFQNEGANFNAFIQGVFPPKLMEQIMTRIKSGEVEDPFKNLPNPESNKGEPATEQTIAAAKFNDFGKPAYKAENRMPTDAELLDMTTDELREAALWVPRP